MKCSTSKSFYRLLAIFALDFNLWACKIMLVLELCLHVYFCFIILGMPLQPFQKSAYKNLSMECCYSIYLVVSSALDWLLVYSCKSEKRATVIYIVLSFTRRYSCNKINIIVAIDALSSNIVTELEWKREALEYFWLCSRIQ